MIFNIFYFKKYCNVICFISYIPVWLGTALGHFDVKFVLHKHFAIRQRMYTATMQNFQFGFLQISGARAYFYRASSGDYLHIF